MKKLILLSYILLTQVALGAKAPATLKYPLDFLLQKVLERKHLNKRDEIPFPKFYYESKTPLKQFQDAIEKQWGLRPNKFSNAFAIENNEIYVSDDAAYYKKTGRCMDDSVVHELTHFIQVRYLNWDIKDESLEWEAIDIQSEFRNEFCKL
ncbi:MAG: hypothetical protein K2Q18_12045 [Bdellovibrionales bacterium]|nr:hypothetical protein [Bdellovibrionales bacterium]